MTHYRYSQFSKPSEPPSPERASGFTRLIVALIVVIIGIIIFKIDIAARSSAHAAALARSQHAQAEIAQAQELIKANSLITFSVASIDESSGSTTWLGSHQPMPAGSMAKVLTAALWLKQVEGSKAKMTQQFGGLSAARQLRLMVQQSDDSAWAYFNDWLGHPALERYAQNLGLYSYDPESNVINASDMAAFLEKLSQGRLLDQIDTQLLLSYMMHTNYEDFITPALGSDLQISHKVGLVDDNVNDAAIITKGNAKLVLVILTDGHGTQDWANRAALMQKLTGYYLKAYFD